MLPGPLSVARRGDFVSLVDEWDPIFSLANVANFSLAVAAGLILAVILWRLALVATPRAGDPARRRPPRRVLVLYVLTEGAIVATAGFLLGLAAAAVMAAVVRIEAFGLTARAVLTAQVSFEVWQ